MKELLPIGTIVKLKNGEKTIMIVGRFQRCKETGEIFDYCAVLWPEGLIDAKRMYLFNHSDVQQLIYLGMQNEEEFLFREMLQEEFEKLNTRC